MPRLLAIIAFFLWPAVAMAADCFAVADGGGRFQAAALAPNEVRLTFLGHSTFVIESPKGVKIATDYAGYSGDLVPDVVTMNRAHRSHYTDTPDPRIKHVLRGWDPSGKPAHHDLQIGDVRIRNVTTDIRGGMQGRVPDGNSIFIFETADLCIGHLGHLHHELTAAHKAAIGRLDVVLVPVDGGYTMAQASMLQVLKDLKARIVIPMHYFGPDTLARFVTAASADFDVQYADKPEVTVSLDTLPKKPTVLVLQGY